MTEKHKTLGQKDMELNSTSVFSLARLLRVVWSKKLFFLITFIIGFCVTLLSVSNMEMRYTAQSIILIKNKDNQRQIEGLSLSGDSSHLGITSLRTELDVLKSRTLATRVVRRLNLMIDPEFNEQALKTGKAESVEASGRQQSTFKNLSVNDDRMKLLNPQTVNENVAPTVTSFIQNLEASFVPGSLAVTVSFSSHSPQKAALIVNSLVDEYVLQRLEAKQKTQKRLTEWMSKRLETLRKQVFAAEKKVEQFSIANDLISTNGKAISKEQLIALKAKLASAIENYQDAKEKLQKSKRRNGSFHNLTSANISLNAELIKDLELQKTRLTADISELSNRYGPKHPTMMSKKSELNALEQKINDEFSKISKTLQNEVRTAKAEVEEIQKQIEEASSQNTYNSDAQIRLRELEREAEASRIVLQTFLETYKKALNHNVLQESGVHVLSYANAPHEPSSLKKEAVLKLGVVTSLILGTLISLFVSKLDTRVKTAEDVKKITGIKCSAVIPYIRGLGKASLTKYIHTNPSSLLTEAIRSLCIRLGGTEHASQVITFISSAKGEGKTTLAVLTATVLAKAGHKVVIVDANLRSPGVGEAIKKSAGSTLVEYLTGRKDLEDAISKDPETGLDIIFGQAIPNTAFDVLNSRKTTAMITSLRSQYDYVIIDTPPCGEVSDTKIVARLSDQNVFVLNWNRTTSTSADKAMRHLDDIPFSSFVMVLNNARSSV